MCSFLKMCVNSFWPPVEITEHKTGPTKKALYFPNIEGKVLTNCAPTHSTDLCRGYISIVNIITTKLSEVWLLKRTDICFCLSVALGSNKGLRRTHIGEIQGPSSLPLCPSTSLITLCHLSLIVAPQYLFFSFRRVTRFIRGSGRLTSKKTPPSPSS